MTLKPADIAVVSRLLDQALLLPLEERESWLAALPAEDRIHEDTLRDMLAQEASLDTDPRLDSLPRLPVDESVAHEDDLVGPYRLIREIGRGGMGSVWLAQRADGSFKRQVALKLPRMAWGAGLAERMARERDIGALLEHPNIARLYDAGIDVRGRPFLSLEYIDGQPIDAWCEAQGLDTRARLLLFIQVARAVAYAHGRLVVHRDLKPSNVLVTADGQAHLLDFGIAKLLDEALSESLGLTQQQGRVLTPHYASPEQVAGEAITVQSDVYSLGVLLYELLTGVLPIAPLRRTLGAVEEAILHGDAPPASSRVKERITARALRGEVDAILAKAMQREPARRYATADALALDIERHLIGETISARPDKVTYRLRKALRRHWVGVSAVSAVLVAVLTGSAVAVAQAQRANEEAERARVVKQFVIDVFKVNSPDSSSAAQLRKLPAEILLDHGAQLIEKRFAGQARLQAELYGVVGGIFSEMGLPANANDYAMRQVATLTAINAGDVEHANALLLLAQTMFDQKRHSDAEVTGRRAIFLAESDIELQLRARVLRARSLLNLGRIADVRDEAALIDGSLLRLPTEPTAVRASAKRLHADLEMRENRFDDAVNLYNMAINESLAAEGSLSRLAIDIRLGLAYGFIVRNRADEARLPRESALSALRELGGGSEIRAALEESILARQAFVMQAMKFDEARNTIVRDREEIAGRGQPVPESILSEIEMNLGKVLYYWGNIQEGDRLVGLASARMRPSIDSLRERWEIVSWRGAIAMDAGRHLEADKLLREGLELRRAMGLGTQPFAAYDYAFVALNLAMMGHQNEGLAVLAAAPTFHAERGDPKFGSAYSESIVETRARLLLDAGAPAQALKWLTKLDEQIKPGQRVRVNDRRFIRGEALCATGANEDGLKILLDAIAAFESTSYPHEPQVARARAVAGHCALTSGHRLLGQRLAAQARTSFIAQPGVSPWYKAPLLKLERALGLRLQPV